MKAIQNHLRNVEKLLLSQADLPNVSNHRASRGSIRENFIREFLMPNLPKNINVVSGEIIDSAGSRSGQIDCILVDSSLPIVHLGSTNHLLVLAEAVVATIEVKSSLNKAEMLKSLASSCKIKSLIRKGKLTYRKGGIETFNPDRNDPIHTYIFGYTGTSLGKLISHVADFAHGKVDGRKHSVEEIVDCICVLNKGVLWRDYQRVEIRKGAAYLPRITSSQIKPIHLKKDSLVAFYQRLIDDIVPLKMENVSLDDYFRFESLE